jgi:hypothetical protein
MSEREQRVRSVTLAMAACAGLTAILGTGCGSDVFDVDVNLQKQTYQANFGTTQGTIPLVACDPAGPDVCGAALGAMQIDAMGATATVQMACDSASSHCVANARVLGTNAVNVLQDDGFITKVERKSVAVVKDVNVSITVPLNTLTFDVPALNLYVGPEGTAHETAAGVVPVGVTAPIAAGTVLTDATARHLIVADDSPAHTFISNSVMAKQTMVFLVVMAPRIDAGAPIPAGALQVDLLPTLTVGF